MNDKDPPKQYTVMIKNSLTSNEPIKGPLGNEDLGGIHMAGGVIPYNSIVGIIQNQDLHKEYQDALLQQQTLTRQLEQNQKKIAQLQSKLGIYSMGGNTR